MGLLIRLVLLILIAYLALRLFRKLTQATGHTTGEGAAKRPPHDPYVVLGLTPPASQLEIQKAYKEQLAKYHPDKVDHLGEDIQVLAKTKTQEIIQAYQALK